MRQQLETQLAPPVARKLARTIMRALHKQLRSQLANALADEEAGRREAARVEANAASVREAAARLGELVIAETTATDPDEYCSEWSEDEVRDAVRSGLAYFLPACVLGWVSAGMPEGELYRYLYAVSE